MLVNSPGDVHTTGALILVFWVLFVNNATGPQGGLIERVSAVSHALWLCLITAAVALQYRARGRQLVKKRQLSWLDDCSPAATLQQDADEAACTPLRLTR